MTPVPPIKAPCVKCGSKKRTVRWQHPSLSNDYDPTLLQLTCLVCGYDWNIPTLDAEAAQ